VIKVSGSLPSSAEIPGILGPGLDEFYTSFA
jgi:hypothetical protein